MQKAHLYEAIFLFNHGMDEAVRGLERLKRAPDLDSDTVDQARMLFEVERAEINSHFCNNLEGVESSAAGEFDKRLPENREGVSDGGGRGHRRTKKRSVGPQNKRGPEP